MRKKVSLIALTTLVSISMSAQKVDYSVVAVEAETGLEFKKVTADNDYVCMPEVKRKHSDINWWTNRVIDVSPDGIKMAYLSYRNNTTNIYLKELNGTFASLQRTKRQNVLDFAFSPDGKKICFSEKDGDLNRIFVTDAEKGYACRQITTNEADYSPTFSNDMKQIFFSRQEINGASIWNYELANNSLTSFTSGLNPCPIKGTNQLLCVRMSNNKSEIWKIDYKTGIEECLVSDVRHSFSSPMLSPDGKWILMVGSSFLNIPSSINDGSHTDTYPNTDIYVCRIDGSELTQLTYHAADDLSPVWSANGKYIYFVSQRGSATGAANVWRMTFKLK